MVKAYAGCGGNFGLGYNDMYQYDPLLNTWTQVANYPLPGNQADAPVSFVIGCLAYVGTGLNISAYQVYQNFYSYNDVTNTWAAVASLPGAARWTGVGFAINGKGYIGTGCSVPAYLPDYWEYGYYTAIIPTDTNLCVSDSVQFRDSSTFNATSWNWYFPGGSPATSTLQSPSVYYPVSGTYTVSLVLTDCGNTDSVSRVINVIGGLGGVNITGNSAICSGVSDTIKASGGTSYLWNTGATNDTIIVSPSTTTTYSVKVTGNGNCTKDTSITITVGTSPIILLTGIDSVCSGNSTTLTASGGTTYLWNTGATTSSISPSPATSTQYAVKVSNGPCAKDTTVNVTVKKSPILTVSPPQDTICSGQPVGLQASGSDFYSWTPAGSLSCSTCSNPTATPSVSTTYTVTGIDSDGCSSTKNINVAIETGIVIGPMTNQSICSGNPATLVANVLSGFGGTYTWQPGGSTSAAITVFPSTTTTYTIEFGNKCGTSTENVTVFVNPSPNPSFSADVTEGCAPLCVQFRDQSNIASGNINQWSWQFGNGDTSFNRSPIYCYTDTGTFSVTHTAVSDNGCSASLQIVQMINVFSKPIANFIYSPQSINFLEPTVQFTDKSTDAYGIVYWTWNFGDKEAPDAENALMNPAHTYADTGTYCPQLMVVNNKGCVDTITQCLFVAPLFTLYIPTAFSPNGDGDNDFFAPKGKYIKSFEMYVFDRWGMELYHTTDITKGWDGTIRGGAICQEDNYIYTIKATDWNNEQHSFTGQFTMVK